MTRSAILSLKQPIAFTSMLHFCSNQAEEIKHEVKGAPSSNICQNGDLQFLKCNLTQTSNSFQNLKNCFEDKSLYRSRAVEKAEFRRRI